MLGGWLPVVIDVVAAVVVLAAIGWRTRRWRLLWVPVCVALGVAGALAVRGFVNNQGLASDPAPVQLWLWSAVCVGAVAVAVARLARCPLVAPRRVRAGHPRHTVGHAAAH